MGLTASANNTAESLLVALLKLWINFFSGGNMSAPGGDNLAAPEGGNLIYTESGRHSVDVFLWRVSKQGDFWLYQPVILIYD